MGVQHKVRVFVFRYGEDGRDRVDYLLLRKHPRLENVLGPVQGPVGIDEHLKDAVLREVREETGLLRPTHLIDLDHHTSLLIGESGIVEWEFGYQADAQGPTCEIVPGPIVAESHWAQFEEAFQALETPADRSTLVRLQMMLHAG